MREGTEGGSGVTKAIVAWVPGGDEGRASMPVGSDCREVAEDEG